MEIHDLPYIKDLINVKFDIDSNSYIQKWSLVLPEKAQEEKSDREISDANERALDNFFQSHTSIHYRWEKLETKNPTLPNENVSFFNGTFS